MTQKKKIRNTVFGVLGAFTLASTPLLAVSCSGDVNTTTTVSTEAADRSVSTLVSDYDTAYDNVLKGQLFPMYTDANVDQLINVVNEYLEKCEIIKYANLSTDGKIWLNSFVDKLQTKLQLLESGIHYLIITPWDTLAFTNYRNILSRNIAKAIKGAKSNDQATANRWLDGITTYLTNVKTNLTSGLAKGVTVSQVMMKHSIGNLLQQSYMKPILNLWVSSNGTVPTTESLTTAKALPFSSTTANPEKVEAANNALLGLVKYLTGEYYQGIKYGGSSIGTAYKLEIVNDKQNEEDNTYIFKQKDNPDKFIKGLGLSTADLDAPDIGVGFIPNDFGPKIYNALLRLNSNTQKTANEIFTLGNSGVKNIKDNMKEVAKTVAKIYAGPNSNWSPEPEYYDEDSSAEAHEAVKVTFNNVVTSSGYVDLPQFFKWLNTNRWFNGRDMRDDQYPTMNGEMSGAIYSVYKDQEIPSGETTANPIKNYDGKTVPYTYTEEFKAKNPGISSVKIGDVIGYVNDGINDTVVWGEAGNLAYKYLVLGLSPATVEDSDELTNLTVKNSISPEAAFVGTSHSIDQYLQYKDVSAQHFNGMFYNTSVDFTLRGGTGGAAYASGGEGSWSYEPEGDGGFYLDSNPYYGLQKWSTSTLASHESISGHVYQFNYAHDHPGKSFAPVFDSTAYAEGWGLFSEWLAVQVGMYGEPAKMVDANSNRLQLPSFGVNSKNIDVTQFKEKDEYANGAYWLDGDDKSTPEVTEEAGNSQKLFDALQYFGFLNERQLRAMRCAVDVGIHAGGPQPNKDGDITNTDSAGKFTKGTGWSLNQARNYLKLNSGLGVDDVKRETKRYLEYSGQAVAYYNGLQVMEGLYMQALGQYQAHNEGKEFMNWSNTLSTNANTAPLFDIILRNNDVPIEVLNEAVTYFISQNY